MTDRRPLIYGLLAVFFILAVVSRVAGLGSIPPGLYGDEALNGTDAQLALSSGEFRLIYLQTAPREGLFIALVSLAIHLLGSTITALRLPSAVAGSLTVLALFFFARECVRFLVRRPDNSLPGSADAFALLATFLLATSYWHLGFSRIAFRAILDPLFAVLFLGLLMRGLRRGSITVCALAGLAAGIGMYAYWSHKAMAIPLTYILLCQGRSATGSRARSAVIKATFNARTWVFVVVAALVAAPWLYAAINRPEEVLARATAEGTGHPLEVLKSTLAVGQMFFLLGDKNWRHNLSGQPILDPIVMVFFAAGLCLAAGALARGVRNPSEMFASRFVSILSPALAGLLLLWWVTMLAPAAATASGRPHSMRAIGAVIPTFLLASTGASYLWGLVAAAVPLHTRPRLAWKAGVVAFALVLAGSTAVRYFWLWSSLSETRSHFQVEARDLAAKINAMPPVVDKYVIAGRREATPDPSPSRTWYLQPIVYLTETAGAEQQRARKLHYIFLDELLSLPPTSEKRIVILVNFADTTQVGSRVRASFPNAEVHSHRIENPF